jgi:uncharacterized protein
MGAFSASVLTTLELATGRRIADQFSLITGISTGGIIAIGLGMGTSAEEILRFYAETGLAIFPSAKGVGGWLKTVRRLRRPKFSPGTLRHAIANDLPIHSFTSSP